MAIELGGVGFGLPGCWGAWGLAKVEHILVTDTGSSRCTGD